MLDVFASPGIKCAQSIIESEDSACPICENVITKSNVKLVNVLEESSVCKLALCGQDPETALNSALASVNFYLQQQQLYFEFREAQLQKKINKVQEACKKKLQEVHTGYTAAKRKYQEVLAVKQQLDGDNQELQQKYSQKAMQARKLQEMFQKVQQENEMLRSGRRLGNAVQMGSGSGQQFNDLLSPAHNMRHQSNAPGSGRVVTTVQHKQMFVPNQQLPSPALLDGAGQFAAAPPGGFLGSKRAGAMQQAVSRQARQEFGAAGNGVGGGGMAGMGFDAPSPSGLQLAGQLSPLQESTFTPHRTQPKHNLRQLLGNTGIGGSGAGFGGGTARKAAFLGHARGTSPSGIASL
ncbi:hypothetical protein WJX77_010475 [Trebouxia sp. C0004]